MTFKSFDTTKRKMFVLWEEAQKQEKDIELLKSENIVLHSEHITKNIVKIPVLVDAINNWSGEVELNGITDWMIPMIKPIGYFSTTDGFDAEEVDFSGGAEIRLFYSFKKIGENLYKFIFELDTDASADFPLFANLYLYIRNDREYDSILKG